MRIAARSAAATRVLVTGLALSLQLSITFLPGQVAEAQGTTTTTAATTTGVDYPVPGGWFYSQEASMWPQIQGHPRGYTVIDDTQGSFWTEFRRYGGFPILGYPVSQRYHYPAGSTDGLWYQAFERGILQWQPDPDPERAKNGLGHAEMANVMEQFTEQNLDAQLAFIGIPAPVGLSPLPARPSQEYDDALARQQELRMSWLVEPRFLGRYLFDPVQAHSSEPLRSGDAPFLTQEQAWSFFGLPQTPPERLTLLDAPNGQSLYPLYQVFLAQRFQKGGLELPLQDAADANLTQTLVPGEGRNGCVALTAVGLLARTIGANIMIPADQIEPMPADPSPVPFVQLYIPAATSDFTQIQLLGTGFAKTTAGEPISIIGLPVPTLPGDPPNKAARFEVARVAYENGSFSVVVPNLHVGLYTIVINDTASHTFTLNNVNLAVPTVIAAATQQCTDFGVPTLPADAAVGTTIPPVTVVAPAATAVTKSTDTTPARPRLTD